MRASEFIYEGKAGKLDTVHADAHTGGYKFQDEGRDRIYNLNQIMKATSMADGKSTKAVDMDFESFAGKNNTAYPYTKEEHNMMKAAFNTVSGTKAWEFNGGHKSVESDDTHKISPAIGFKGFGKETKKTQTPVNKTSKKK
jgi:hypothetical protein